MMAPLIFLLTLRLSAEMDSFRINLIVFYPLSLIRCTKNSEFVNVLMSSTLVIEELVISYPRLISFLVAIAITVLLFLFLKHTYLGRAIRATAEDNTGARLMGVNINRVYIFTFGLGSACVGVAGALLMPIYYAFPTVGLHFVLTAFVLHLLIMVFTSIALGLAWNIIGGYGGQLSFGHAAFYGIGAYTSTLLFVHFGITPWAGMIAGGILAVITSLILGIPCFRLRGTYFTLATIALVEQNVKESLDISHRGYVLENGKIVLEGPARELLQNTHLKKAYLGM